MNHCHFKQAAQDKNPLQHKTTSIKTTQSQLKHNTRIEWNKQIEFKHLGFYIKLRMKPPIFKFKHATRSKQKYNSIKSK